MIADVHAHVMTPALLRLAAERPFGAIRVAPEGEDFAIAGYGPLDRLIYRLEERFADLDRVGIDLQLVAPPPPFVSHPGYAATAEAAALLNESTQAAVAASGGRLRGLIVPQLGTPEGLAEQIRRVAGEFGFPGVALSSSAAGAPLDEPVFAPMFKVIDELGLVVFMHAVSAVPARPALAGYSLNTVLQWPHETSIAVARLVFSGLFERLPGLKLVLSHGGGTLPYLAGRLDLAYEAPEYEANPDCRRQITRPPSHYLRQLYYDTVVASRESLELLLRFAGAERVVFGSDYPYEIGDARGGKALPALAAMALSEADRDRILGGTLRALLPY